MNPLVEAVSDFSKRRSDSLVDAMSLRRSVGCCRASRREDLELGITVVGGVVAGSGGCWADKTGVS